MKNHFTHLLRVRYSECDAQQVVFNAKYIEYVDIAVTEYLRAIWGSYSNMLDAGIDSQVVNLNISWNAPAHFDEVLEIKIHTARIGNTSYTLQVEFFNYLTKSEIASVEVVYVMVSAKEHVKMKIPEHLKLDLNNGAPGVVSNHAGAE